MRGWCGRRQHHQREKSLNRRRKKMMAATLRMLPIVALQLALALSSASAGKLVGLLFASRFLTDYGISMSFRRCVWFLCCVHHFIVSNNWATSQPILLFFSVRTFATLMPSSCWPLRRQNYKSWWIAKTESVARSGYSSTSTRPR